MSSDEPNSDEVDLDIPEDDQGDPDMDEWWTWSNFARLFIVPLVIVVVAVSLYGLFQFMISDSTTVEDYISEMETGTERSRWRAAFDLAQKVQADGAAKELSLSDVRQLIRLYSEAKQPKIRRYLARVLGYVPTPESQQALVDGLDDPEPGVRVNTILALGQQEASSAAPAIAKRLDDDRPEVRRMAAYVLGSLDNREVTDQLRSALDDPTEDVRWNAAIALARLGDDSGRDVLVKNLRQARDGELDTMEPGTRANLLVNTIKALVKIDHGTDRSLLEELRDNDPAPSVREEATRALETLFD